MSKALTASVVIGAALSASYNNVFKTAKQKQYELGKAFADTNKKLKASDAVVEYQHKLTALKRKYAQIGGGNKRMAAGIADLEKRYRAAKRELKSYGVAVGDAWSFPPGGNGLNKPLDFSSCRAATGILGRLFPTCPRGSGDPHAGRCAVFRV